MIGKARSPCYIGGMSDETALLDAIRAAPDDDAPRLVYADWLEENGQPERAEFIRVQCALVRRNTKVLRRREAELLAAHHDMFAGSLAASHLRYRFHRGFIVAFGHTGVFRCIRHSDQIALNHCILFRFWPTGECRLSGFPSLPGHEDTTTVDWAYRLSQGGRHLPPTGKYTLSPLGNSPDLTVVCSEVIYRAVLRGAELVADEQNQLDGSVARRRFTHYPIPAFDSFPET
jgi:uncharacterized protein (TIGR02996 family)